MPETPRLPEQWRPVTDEALTLEREAAAEIGAGHELDGRTLTAVARCSACDDVIYRVGDDTWAIVHLSWRGRTEPAPWPRTTRLGSFLALDLAASQHEH
jgi:hypothetical protein